MLGKNEEQPADNHGAIQIRINLTSSNAINPGCVRFSVRGGGRR